MVLLTYIVAASAVVIKRPKKINDKTVHIEPVLNKAVVHLLSIQYLWTTIPKLYVNTVLENVSLVALRLVKVSTL